MARGKAVFSPRGVASGPSSHSISMCIIAFILLGLPSADSQKGKIYFDSKDINVLVGQTGVANLVQVGEPTSSVTLTAEVLHPEKFDMSPTSVDIPGSGTPNPKIKKKYPITVVGKELGNGEVTFQASPSGVIDADRLFLRVLVIRSRVVYYISYIMGWMYFLAWSVSFYPQIYTNYKRKSVVGLNFDFITLNIMGFSMYSLFNCGLYFSRDIQAQYFENHPHGHNPVQLNDVFFSLHAAFATILTITQCFLYERASQRISIVCRGIMGVFCAVFVTTFIVAACGKLTWLNFLYVCSYIKLTITFIKYVPQGYMNYKRKSTIGWSIGNIFLDLTGGLLSILQMMLNAYNHSDWASFFGDFTKFGLGLFSLLFDLFFIVQHYVLYRAGKDFIMVNSSDEGSDMSSGEERDHYILGDGWHPEEKTTYDLNNKA